MRVAEITTAALLALLSLYLMWKSGEPPAWNPDVGRFANIGMIEGEGPGSGFWPFWLSVGMLISSLWIGVNWFRGTSPFSRSREPLLDSASKRSFLLVSGGLLGFLIAIEFLGFYGAIFLFLIYYIRFLGRHSILQTSLIAVLTPIVAFFFFDVTMRIVLPKGYLEPLFIPLYDIFL
ncbi:MAG: tripartite tricarboxylate transporter TctB family protein [Limibacillus sp.]|jgi:putative tricarboxylic transport membrane protein